MSSEKNDYFSPIRDPINKFREYLSDRTLITDLISKLIITFGVVLIIGGLYLMISDPAGQTSATQTMISTVNWIPGIPFYMGSLASSGASASGLTSWLVGLDLLLVGLGLWVRHKLARFVALIIFALAAFFQFVQFLYNGIAGAPVSVLELCVEAVFIYFLFSKFDSRNEVKRPTSKLAA